MKKTHSIIFSMVFIISLFSALYITTAAIAGKPLINLLNLEKKSSPAYSALGTCSQKSKINNLENANDTRLQALANYQTICNSYVTNKIMIFTNMPNSEPDAHKMASDMSHTLNEFSNYHIEPIIVVEPETSWGLVDFTEFRNGFYLPWVKDYFSELKAQGITDQNIGTWVPFPEANLPNWNRHNATPADFATIVNQYLGALKNTFPKAKGSILLNSATYQDDDFDWASGDYVSLLPYVSGLQKNLIDSFGFQGFPWAPPASTPGNGIFDAREYLNSDLAIEAANKIGVKKIWFNTGTFYQKYTQDPEKMVTISPEKRKDIAFGILNEVQRAKDQGFNVEVNLFSEDKSQVAEATDWSYLTGDKKNGLVFIDFVNELNNKSIAFSLYDNKK